MKTYHPQVEVRLIKTVRRKEFVAGVAADGLRYDQLRGINLTDYLGEAGAIHTSKSVRDPAGAFSITLADQAHQTLLETIYALVEPMDVVEIRMAHSPFEYRKAGKNLPIVMRGLVSSVSRSETMAAGRPVRKVTIAGHDYGKVLQTLQIYYLNNTPVGVEVLSAYGFFQKFQVDAKIKQANDFVRDIVDRVINPYLSRMLNVANGESVGSAVVREFTPKAGITGEISPESLYSYVDVSVDALLRAALDVGPFNEMFVQDREDGVDLVVRPVPFRKAGESRMGNVTIYEPVQAGATADELDISADDIVSLNVSRSDSGVYNYYWVTANRWQMIYNMDMKSMAQYGEPGGFLLLNYPNCSESIYGMRKLEVDLVLGGDNYSNSDALPASAMPSETVKMSTWLDKRRAVLAEMNKDNVLFESGTIRVRGNENIKPGMFLNVKRGTTWATYYVVSAVHEFVPFEGYYTNLTVERGTGFIERGQKLRSPYFAEIDAGGA